MKSIKKRAPYRAIGKHRMNIWNIGMIARIWISIMYYAKVEVVPVARVRAAVPQVVLLHQVAVLLVQVVLQVVVHQVLRVVEKQK